MNYKKCDQNRKDCFAYCGAGKCFVLDDTKFNYPCPFYKTNQQLLREDPKSYREIKEGCLYVK